MEEIELERKKLEETLSKIEKREALVVKKLMGVNGLRDRDMAKFINEHYHREYFNIKKHKSSPYFAKLIYRDDQEAQDEEMYIGKVGFLDEDSNEIVVDWRAPIASLYYDSEKGRVNYSSPEGLKFGELKLKRQISVEGGAVKNIYDSDYSSNDELLKPYLSVSADIRLKSIVATIQKEQNEIIRSPRGNIVVQGVAGSGKTTVALHRLSYLIYLLNKFDTTEDFLIIGPNGIFLKYISSVLPELDTGNVSQLTYEELAKEVVGEKFSIIDKNIVLKEMAEGIKPPDYLMVKTGLKFKLLIDLFLEESEKAFLPESVGYKGVELYSRDELYKMFLEVRGGNLHRDLLRLCEHISTKLRYVIRSEELIETFMARAKAKGVDISLQEKWELEKTFSKGSTTFFKKQIVLKNISILEVYRRFLEYLSKYPIYEELSKHSLKNLENKKVEFEDLGALIYLKQRLMPCEEFNNICSVVIDEAQDFGIFHLVALKALFCNALFDLYGDMNQAIRGFSSISSWEEVKSQFMNGRCNYFELKKSYRTTIEIMECANLIASAIPLVQAVPVIRHGERVKNLVYNEENYAEVLSRAVNEEMKNFSSVAVLCKTSKECMLAHDKLKESGISCRLISDKSQSEIGGVMVLTIQESKGLEFDSVIINDASDKMFDEKNVLDMKLLYVAITRAMHSLKILSNGQIVKVIESGIEKLV